MSVHGMKPNFTDYQGYQAWRSDWRELYAHASSEVRQSKNRIKELQRTLSAERSKLEQEDKFHLGHLSSWNQIKAELGKLQKEQVHKRVIACKLMTVLEEAKIRWQNISNMRKGIEEQKKEFPLEVETKNIDFHFNKKSIEFDFIPMWVVKARGKTFYVNHMECLAGFTTRETPDHPSTKGSLRVKRGTLSIDTEGNAVIQ